MKRRLLLLALLLATVSGVSAAAPREDTRGNALQGQDVQSDKQAQVASLIQLLRDNDRQAMAQRVDYPLTRARPIPPVIDERDFIERFDDIFDPDFVALIVSSDPDTDWVKVGERGIMLDRGVMWLDTRGNILAVLHQSSSEQTQKAELISAQKAGLYKSLSRFEAPMLAWETEHFRVRIDDLGQGNYRYAAWPVERSFDQKPALVLTHGDITYEGSGGNHHYTFENGPYRYVCDVVVIGHSDSPPGWLRVYKGDTLLLEEDVKTVL